MYVALFVVVLRRPPKKKKKRHPCFVNTVRPCLVPLTWAEALQWVLGVAPRPPTAPDASDASDARDGLNAESSISKIFNKIYLLVFRFFSLIMIIAHLKKSKKMIMESTAITVRVRAMLIQPQTF